MCFNHRQQFLLSHNVTKPQFSLDNTTLQSFHMDRNLSKVRKHWENNDTISLKDHNLRILERDAIVKHLKVIEPGRLADIGCGDCLDTLEFAQYSNSVYAYDYSNHMLAQAKKNLAASNLDNIILKQRNLLKDSIDPGFDVVVSKRTLINLGNIHNQERAIAQIADSLESKRYLLLLECSIDGLRNLNTLRNQFGLPNIDQPQHNTHFDLQVLTNLVGQFFTPIETVYFSEYFFLTRVVSPLVLDDNYMRHDELLRKLSTEISIETVLSPQFLMVLQKL